MNRRSPSVVELHCEKVLLGAAAALAVYLAWGYLLKSPNTVAYEGRRIAPSELNEAILQEALFLERGMEAAEPPLPTLPRYHDQLRERHAAGIFGAEAESDAFQLPRELRLTAAFGTPFHVPVSLHAPVRLVTPLPPTRPTIETGRCLLAVERSDAGQLREDSAGERVTTWVRIAARFDVEQQRAAMLAAGYPPYAARVYIAGVDAQRQELLADDRLSEWQDVPCVAPPLQIPAPLFEQQTGQLLNRDALDAAFAELKASPARVACPSFGEVIAGDRPTAAAEPPAEAGGADAEDSTVVWVHDTSAEPGQSYRYRIRVRLWNRFVGRPRAVQDEADARRTVLAGAWSAPSEVVTATPRHHLFLLGRSVDGSAANVEVWAWHRGRWLRKSFVSAVGDVIGGVAKVKTGDVDEAGRPIREKIDFNTGAVVLDLRTELHMVRVAIGETGRFEWVEQATLVVVYLDPADGRVMERSQVADRVAPVRKELRQEAVKTSTPVADTDGPRPPRPVRPRP
jgi:hypothetical protein